MSNSLQGFNANAVSFANDVDFAMTVHVVLSIGLFLSVVAPMFYFAWKYRADKVNNEDIGTTTHHTLLEITWTVIPIIIVMIFFYYGNTTMKQMRTMPEESESLVINVEGSKWKWKYEYPANEEGHVHKITSLYDQTTGSVKRGLYVPKGKNIILKMTAPLNDVIHAYYIPAFRTKEDVVPGRVTKLWFNANKVGTFDVECAEYCGTAHSYMYSKIVVMEPEEFDAWFKSKKMSPGEAEGDAIPRGQQVYEENGCAACHAIDSDTTLVGPGLKGIGEKYDAQYLKDAIVDPDKDIPEGFVKGVMPPFALPDADVDELVKYMQSAK
jgi:cytochrome c oxidase subunit 2